MFNILNEVEETNGSTFSMNDLMKKYSLKDMENLIAKRPCKFNIG